MSNPPHPGIILKQEFLDPLGISAYQLAKCINDHHKNVYGLIAGERDIHTNFAIKLAIFFNTTPEFWILLQAKHDIHIAKIEHKAVFDRIEAEKALYLEKIKRRKHGKG